MKKVAVIMGSDSDLPVVEKAISKLAEFGVPCEVHVFSAHRTPAEAADFSKKARGRGFGAIIAAAGKAAHLAGAIAANTTLPVIGIPIKSSNLDGLDALLSTVQMPSGIPVATVAIDGAEKLKRRSGRVVGADADLVQAGTVHAGRDQRFLGGPISIGDGHACRFRRTRENRCCISCHVLIS